MLNKKIPYKNIIMEIKSEDISKIKEPVLPEGYTFCFFEEGMEKDWARIETSVLEFGSENDALKYFVRDYLPFENELRKRCVFIKNPKGIPVATGTAWFSDTKELGYAPSLHWIAVHPDCQGLGLGRAIIQKVTRLFLEVDKGLDVILHTQTWSEKAVLCYMKLGYYFCKDKKIAIAENGGKSYKIYPNDFNEALEVLKDLYDKSIIQEIIRTAK